MRVTSACPEACPHCGDEDCGLINDPVFGWICDSCRDDYERIERETDWDRYEEERRRKIAEANEY